MKYAYSFEVRNKIPTNTDEAGNLGRDVNRDYGDEGWELVSVTPIPNSAGMLLAFKKEV